jgi:Ca2+-binding EF-hand superfamily protein
MLTNGILIGINVFSDEEFKASFDKVDKDHSGFITPDEVE